MTIQQGDKFVRNVIQRHGTPQLLPEHSSSFPCEGWFWCGPHADSSSLPRGRTIVTYEYTALCDFQLHTIEDLKHILPPQERERMSVAFANFSNPLNEASVLKALVACHQAQGVVGLHRTIGSGKEYVFFSALARDVFEVRELKV